MLNGVETDPRILTAEEQSNYTLGYCSNANEESGDNAMRYVTRDMAIDAGDPSLEGEQF